MKFNFQNPFAFFLLLAPLFFFALKKAGLFSEINFSLSFSDWNGFSFLWSNRLGKIVSFFSSALIFCAYVLCVFAFAEPVLEKTERVFTSRGADILFVLDTSPSMAARDIGGSNRITAAKNAITLLANENEGAAFALVAMASEAALVVPLTTDTKYFCERLSEISLGQMGSGTAIGNGLSCAVYHLSESGAEKKCVVLLTDGENNAGEIHPETAMQLALKNKIPLYTVGIGTSGTVPLDYQDPNTGRGYSGYLDSNFDSEMLEKISAALGGRYYGAESVSALSQALSAIAKKQSVSQTFYLRNEEFFLYEKFLLAAILCFAFGWIFRRVFLKRFF